MTYKPFYLKRNIGNGGKEWHNNSPLQDYTPAQPTGGTGILGGIDRRVADVAGKTVSGMMGVPGSTFSGILSDGLQGNFNPAKTSKNLVKDLLTIGGGAPSQLVSPLTNAAASLIAGDTLKATATRTGVGTGISLAAGAIGGLPGIAAGLVLGGLAEDSYQDGILGDIADSRQYESTRDTLEDSGYSRKDSKGISKDIASWENRGIRAPQGLSTRPPAGQPTLSERMLNSFRDYPDRSENGSNDIGGDSKSSDRSSKGGIGGVSGADMGKGSEEW